MTMHDPCSAVHLGSDGSEARRPEGRARCRPRATAVLLPHCTLEVNAETFSGQDSAARMGPPGLEWLWFVLEGARSNLWGYRCPIYCSQPDGPLLILTFLLGALTGAGAILWFFRPWASGHISPSPLQRPSTSTSSRRLALYGQRG